MVHKLIRDPSLINPRTGTNNLNQNQILTTNPIVGTQNIIKLPLTELIHISKSLEALKLTETTGQQRKTLF